MTTIQLYTRMRPTRRATLGLLAAVAVTLGAAAGPLAGTADAGRKGGSNAGEFRGMVGGPVGVHFDAAGSTPGIGEGHPAAPGSYLGGGMSAIETLGSKCSCSGGMR